MKKLVCLSLSALTAAVLFAGCRQNTRPVIPETTVPLATVRPTEPTRETVRPTVPSTAATETTVPHTTIEDGNGLLPSQTEGF